MDNRQQKMIWYNKGFESGKKKAIREIFDLLAAYREGRIKIINPRQAMGKE